MLYVRERRLWVWLAAASGPEAEEGSAATMALSVNRRTLDNDREFEQLKQRLLGIQKDTAS